MLWLLILFTPLTFASEHSDDFDFLYYAGIAAGGTYKMAEMEEDLFFQIAGISNEDSNQTFDSSKFSPIAQLQFGTGMRNELFYLGVEVVAQFFDGDFDSDLQQIITIGQPRTETVSSKSQLRLRDFEVAFDLKPGIYLYEDTLLYGRVGIGINRLHLNTSAHLTYHPVIAEKEISDDVYPFRLGFGLEREIEEDITIFLDYVVSFYSGISGSASNTLMIDMKNTEPTAFTTSIDSEATDIMRQSIQIGLNYYF